MNTSSSLIAGSAFDKIQIEILGFQLLEPNTFIGDLILFIVAMYMAGKTTRLKGHDDFFRKFKWFFILFGLTFLAGGLGHLFFKYWSVEGKYTGWYLGIISTCMLELALISIYPDPKRKIIYQRISIAKMVAAMILETWALRSLDLLSDPSLGLQVPSLNAAIGQALVLGGLGLYYHRKISEAFRFFWISLIVIVPSAIAQTLNINLAQWFDKNDIGHVFLLFVILIYFKGLSQFSQHLLSEADTEEEIEDLEASVQTS